MPETKAEIKPAEKEDLGCLATIGLLAILPFVMVVDTLVSGYILYNLWGWFLVKLGLPVISMMHALGISLTMKMFVDGIKIDKEKHEKQMQRWKIQGMNKTACEFFGDSFKKAIAGLIVLLIGYIIHCFV
jgi:hypothetical protein